MKVIHNEAKYEEIAKKVLMPGDPLRAKYIADNFLEDVVQVNTVRNMFAYTGKHKGEEITVMGSGMGMPSMGIYAYELFTFYDVELILRVGSCGAYGEELNINDIILVNSSYSEGNFARNLTGVENHVSYPDEEMVEDLKNLAEELSIDVKLANTACSECFEGYTPDIYAFSSRFPEELDIKASEMEAFALFETAKLTNKKAACLLTVADIIGKEAMDIADRETSLNTMINLALEYLSRY